MSDTTAAQGQTNDTSGTLDAGAPIVPKVPIAVAHYADKDPRHAVGGVEAFGRNLQNIFAEVEYFTPATRGLDRIRRSRLPVICDNQRVVDWPEGYPVIGFQHGVAAVKYEMTRELRHWFLARAQRRAARRPLTLWVACANWVGATFQRLHGNGARHVIYYPVDVEKFDGCLDNAGSRLVVHDGRTRHKGREPMARLAAALPGWRIEPLGCPPEAVPDRMRAARAFLHLSRYEGNSNVCLEAMAMDLPCLLTRVGVFSDTDGPTEVECMDVAEAYDRRGSLVPRVTAFLDGLEKRTYHPRPWVLAHATIQTARAGWWRVMADFQTLSGWNLGVTA